MLTELVPTRPEKKKDVVYTEHHDGSGGRGSPRAVGHDDDEEVRDNVHYVTLITLRWRSAVLRCANSRPSLLRCQDTHHEAKQSKLTLRCLICVHPRTPLQ